MPADTTAWEQALTQMEDDLDKHEEQVRLGEASLVPAWEPPEDLGPMPAQLAERATNLVRRIGLLTTFVQFQLTAAENDLKHLAQHPGGRATGNKAIAMYLDASV
ncbi:hypothetical protein [Gephyromycinifex aptenodytis]|uniref:hypothetical protein n=1 Tax=Gephyromycinifex aptenodytis TaxID=2716227 RepID=UPI001D029AA3|nr:hypothetical protein [Gephyromycinifex aptenodytis]